MSNPETREYVTGPGFTSRLAWAQLRASLRGWTAVPVVLIYVALGIGVVRLGGDGIGWGIALAAFLLFIVLVYSGLLFWIWRIAERTSPTGTRYSVALGERSMTIAVGPLSSELPYSVYSRVRRQGSFVALRLRSSSQSVVLPIKLFPSGDFDRLAAAVADPAAATTAQALPGAYEAGFDREYVTDAGFTGRLARWSSIRAFTRWPSLVMLGVVTFVGGLLLLFALLSLLLAALGITDDPDVGPVFALAAFVFGLPAIVAVGSFLVLRVQLRRTAPVGSIYALGLGDSVLRVRGPINTSDIPYSSYRVARRRGEFVEVVGNRGITRMVLPAQLLPDTELDRLNALLGDA